MSSFVCLVSCTEQESDLLSANQSSNNQLSIVTHTREGETPIASVYLFNANNAFVRTLQTDAAGDYSSASASVKLPEGTYTLCALSPNDLSHFQIPETLTPTSAITLAEGQAMSDLLIGSATTTLSDGENGEVDLELQRKVLELSSITISQVPDGVTGVTVSIAPFYSAIQFNGEYIATDPATVTFTLTATATDGVWQVAPEQFVFPSVGKPTITVTFTRDNGDPGIYTYETESAFSANNKYNIAGTYTEPLGVTLSGGITSQEWPADPVAIDFEFDETNAGNNSGGNSSSTSEVPVVGQLYNGYYVVSVDAINNNAVLLNKSKITDAKDNTYEDILSNITKPQGATGNWRIPTVTECQTFLSAPSTPGIFGDSDKEYYYCYNEGALNRCQAEKSSDGNITFSLMSLSGFVSFVFLRPVIDISY
ncbi:MAG: FimB/Mfa2 family fimbrial subunit [Prevotella sp.]|nr:FimB/Mfa2 family fimbrial subunit [Prevotella sp.]